MSNERARSSTYGHIKMGWGGGFSHTHIHRFEKYIGGKYLGELTRCVLETLAAKRLFLLNGPPHLFPEPWTFGTDNVSKIEQYINNIYIHRHKIIENN